MPAPKSLTSLLLDGSGEFNHSIWQAQPSLFDGNPLDLLVTLHEWSHFELNNVSTVGIILTFLAELARHASGDRERCTRLLNAFVQRSRVAHEVYATWYSVEHLAAAHPRETLLAGLPPDYLAYHAVGARVVSGIKGPFLRHQVFLTAMRSCFEAAPFAAFVPSTLDSLRIANFRSQDYPDNRLQFLLENPPAAILGDSAAEFCRSFPDRPIVALIEGALEKGEGDAFFAAYSPDADNATLQFLQWLYADLARFLTERQRPIGPFGHHLSLVPPLIAFLDQRSEPSSTSRRLITAKSPHDAVAMIFRQMENEVFRVKDEPMRVSARPITDLPTELWSRLPVGTAPHLVVYARTLDSMKQQHGDFEAASDLSQVGDNGTLVFLRRREPAAGATLFYFTSPAELALLREKTRSVPAYGVVSSIICGDGQWLTNWLNDSVVWLTLIEHSLHAFLLQDCKSADKIIYEVSTIRDGDKALTFLSFLTTTSEPGGSLYLSVCSELAAKSCLQFIELSLRDPRFVRDGTLFTTDLAPILTTVVTHLWRDETFFNSNELHYS